MKRALFSATPLLCVVWFVTLLVYVVAQQIYRTGHNDPQMLKLSEGVRKLILKKVWRRLSGSMI
ncbi:hypothetical protein EBR66_03670 [bacterium]|nr:hypothetical protein [bacterium]